MTIDAWLQAAIADAERRGLPEMKPILETLARATTALRAADFNIHATHDDDRGARTPPARAGDHRRTRDRGLPAADRADNGRLNAFILVMADDALRQARNADRELTAGQDRGPLHGVPISVKDLIDMRGVPTTAASRVREGHVAGCDAPTIAHLRQAGAVIVGKTNLHEFAFGTTNEDSAFGPARNPHDPARSPGGSSGGSAASVAAGMALATIGTDTGGSIRIPAAACGIVGLKPSLGEVSTDGVVPLSRTMDHVGPLTLSVGMRVSCITR